MTNEVANYNDIEFQKKLRAMSGQFVGGSQEFIPKVAINKAPEKDGVDLPVGAFMIKRKDDIVYSKRKEPVKFRLYARRYVYSLFDGSVDNGKGKPKGKTVAWSVQLPGFGRGNEYISTNGLLKCGRASYADEDKKRPKAKTLLYGTVSFNGTTDKGTEVTITDLPVIFAVGGKQMVDLGDYLKDFEKDGKQFFDYEMDVKATFVPSDGGGFYNVDFVFADLTNRLPFGDETFKTLEKFCHYINANNKAVEEKFNQVLNKQGTPAENAPDGIVDSPEDDLASDMIEEEDAEV